MRVGNPNPKYMNNAFLAENYFVIVLYRNYSETLKYNAIEFKFLVQDCLILRSNHQVAQSSKQAPAASEIVSSIPTSDSWHLCEELVNTLSTVVGLLSYGTPVREC